MRFEKPELLLVIVTIILLSVLSMTRTGELCHEETDTNKNKVDNIYGNFLEDESAIQEARRFYLQQEYEIAYGKFATAGCIAHIYGSKDEELEATMSQGNCAYWIGAVDSCINRYLDALEIARELKRTSAEYEIYSKLRDAYLVKVDMETVYMITQKMDSLLNITPDKQLLIVHNQQLAVEAMQQQNWQLTEQYLKTSEMLLKQLPSKQQISAQFSVYGVLCDYYSTVKNYDQALRYSKLYAEAGKTGFGRHQMAYMCYDKAALICAQFNNKQGVIEALDSMRYGISLDQGASQSNVVHYYDVEGSAYLLLGDWQKACLSFRKALVETEGTFVQFRMTYYVILKKLTYAYNKLKLYDKARECNYKMAYCCRSLYGEECIEYAVDLWGLAEQEKKCGDVNAAKQCYIKAIEICKDIVRRELRYVSVQNRNSFWLSFAPIMWGMASFCEKIGEKQSPFTQECYEAHLFSKAFLLETDRSMAAEIKLQCTQQEQQMYEDMLYMQSQLKNLMKDYDKNKERVTALQRKISDLDNQLTPTISKLGYTSFLNLGYRDIQQSLGADEVLLDFSDYIDANEDDEHRHVAFIINKDQKFPKLVKSITEQDIKMLLGGKPKSFLYKITISDKALDLLWKPFEDEVQGKKTIYYVPSGMLHEIAIESLPMSDGSLLGEHYHFVRLTSAREVVKLKQDNFEKNLSSAALFGGLKYDMDTKLMAEEASRYNNTRHIRMKRGILPRGLKKFGDLPNTKIEVDAIEDILKKTGVKVSLKTGTKGNEEAFLAMDGMSPEILHIATHGFYFTQQEANDVSFLKGYNDAMMLSGLIMAGGNLAWMGKQIPKGVLSGVLTASEIASLDLRGTSLAVLSACQTGLGMTTPEGIYGLQRAFKKAGVQTIMMSLWSVDDEATKDFMILFYKELANSSNNWDKRKAFESAKDSLRRIPKYRNDPYYWAGFVMLD